MTGSAVHIGRLWTAVVLVGALLIVLSACQGDGTPSVAATVTVTQTVTASAAEEPFSSQPTLEDENFLRVAHERQLGFIADDALISAAHQVCETFVKMPNVSTEIVAQSEKAALDAADGTVSERQMHTLYVTAFETLCPTVKPETPAPTPKPTPKPKSYGDGTYLVGTDMPAGTYRNGGGRQGEDGLCVAYASSKPNDLATYLRGSTSAGPAILSVNEGEYFNIAFCLPFTLDK